VTWALEHECASASSRRRISQRSQKGFLKHACSVSSTCTFLKHACSVLRGFGYLSSPVKDQHLFRGARVKPAECFCWRIEFNCCYLLNAPVSRKQRCTRSINKTMIRKFVPASQQAKPKRGHSGRPTGKIVAIVTTASANVREKSI
jgi:hypothetical protein